MKTSKRQPTSLLDEHVPRDLEAVLTAAGHQCFRSKLVLGENVADAEIDRYAKAKGYAVVTQNVRDFQRVSSRDRPFLHLGLELHLAAGVAVRFADVIACAAAHPPMQVELRAARALVTRRAASPASTPPAPARRGRPKAKPGRRTQAPAGQLVLPVDD